MARLRVASAAEGQPESGFADTARQAMEQALAAGAVVLVILYETPDSLGILAVPNAVAVQRGLVGMAHAELQPDPPSAAD